MRKLIPIIALASALAFAGCKATLEPGGAYAPTATNDVTGVITATQMPDIGFYNTDATYSLAWSAINGAFDFERNNRLLLWRVSPNVKHTLDGIRPQAVVANEEYLRARAVYLANPVPTGLTKLQTILARLNQISAAATAVLPKGN